MRIFQPLSALLLWAYLLCPSSALASPTTHEFLPCHQRAAVALQTCLDQQPGSRQVHCWGKSKKHHDACYREVFRRHQPDPKQRAAMEKAMAAQKAKMEQGRQAVAAKE